MQGRIQIYVNRENKEYFEKLQAITEINGGSLSGELGRAAETYLRLMADEPRLLADKKDWDRIINKMSKDDILEAQRLISVINSKMLRKLCKK